MPGNRRAARWLVEDWTELRAQHLEFDESELVQVIEFLQKDDPANAHRLWYRWEHVCPYLNSTLYLP